MANARIVMKEGIYLQANDKVKKLFRIQNLTEHQEEGLKSLLNGRDVLTILPTGSGKSLIFQCFPIVFDVMHSKPPDSPSICLVISPLSSLMQDQVMYLKSVGIKAAFIGDDQTDEEIKKKVEAGYYQLVYGSPEAFLASSRWRKVLSSDVYRDRVCLIAVDEAHCIQHW
jgi:ATP-dependent DNA helicase RecQ